MLKELLKRLQQREFSESQEQELLAQMQEAEKIIEENKAKREELLRAEINKDETKVKNLDELDAKIEEVKKKIKRQEEKGSLFATLYALFTVGVAIGSIFLSFALSLPVILQFVSPFITGFACIASIKPVAKLFGKKEYKLKVELENLKQQKQEIIDEVNAEIEALAMKHLKLTNVKDLTARTSNTIEEEIINEDNVDPN